MLVFTSIVDELVLANYIIVQSLESVWMQWRSSNCMSDLRGDYWAT
jgi:hypothetical protein